MERIESSWRELQKVAAARAAVTLAVFSWLSWWYMLAQPQAELGLVVLAVLSMLGGLLLWRQADSHPRAVSAALVGGTFAVIAMASASFQAADAVYFFVLPVMLAGYLWHPWAGVGLALAALTFLSYAVDLAANGTTWSGPGMLLIAVAVVQTPILAQLRANLQQTWFQNIQILKMTEEVRTHRGEVSRLNKSLGTANTLLQRRARELAAARREAEIARHMKEQFAIYVSHELRTPLNIILGFVEVMQRFPEIYSGVDWTPTLRSDVGEIQRSARHLSDLVDDLLDLARIEVLKMPLHREQVNPQDVLDETVNLARRLLRDKFVEMRVDIPHPLPSLFIDRTRIRQVLLNLLANASRFTEQGEIRVRAVLREEEIEISVADTGVGISDEDLVTLFADFRQISDRDASTGEGKGLGLAIAKRFVTMHGGRIWAESQMGRGSTFYFTLPLTSIEVSRSTTSRPLQEVLDDPSPKVVLIDEDTSAAAYLRRRLEGYEVLTAPDLEEARTLVHRYHPHALLLNVPPDMDDADQGPAPPIPVDGAPLLQCSLPVGSWLIERELFDDWLIKPIGPDRLLKVIEKYCKPGDQVLVVDDDVSFVQLVRRILLADGERFKLQWTPNGRDALDILQEERPHLMLLDIALPGMDGYAVAKKVCQDEAIQPLPIVAISALLPDTDMQRVHSCTFSVTKRGGFRETELLQLIECTLQQVKPRYVNGDTYASIVADPATALAS